ncbi:MAG: ABC transporter ATP-binding protein [Alphaproteobacteria bacterium]|nr:ABC transporter ATP-binding protein [Alphaproteobacteria bacterium]
MTEQVMLGQTPVADAPLLDIRNLSISYYSRTGEIPAVIDFSLRLGTSEAIGLVGESGCGKSTVALAIMRYLGRNGAIVGGQILFKGRDIMTLPADELRKLRGGEIAMVYQEPMSSLNPSMTIGDQLIEVPVYHENASRHEAYDLSLSALDDVGLPDPARVASSYPHQISGGQQQRVVIAMALLSRPSLLLLDEPTTALDVTVEAGIVDLIASLAEKHQTGMLYISHNLGLVLETCSRVNVMYSGEVVEEAGVDALFDTPRHPYTKGLFDCIPLPDTDRTAKPLAPIRGQLPLPNERPEGCNFAPRCDYFEAGTCDTGPVALSGDDVDHHVRCTKSMTIDFSAESTDEPTVAPQRVASAEALKVTDLKKYYTIKDRGIGALISRRGTVDVKANEAITLSAKRGETLAIVGESGCGKSTFAKVLMGLEKPTDGEILLDGQPIGATPVRHRSKAQLASLQMVFQDPNETLNPSHTVGWQIARVVNRLSNEYGTRVEVANRVKQLLELVKLPGDFANRKPRQLSGGQKQRVGIARAFAGNPSLVVADEPLSALDVSVQAAVTELLMDIQREHGTTLLFISHDLGVVRYLADHVVVMYLGRIMESGLTKDVFAPPYHPYTEALLSAVPIANTRYKKKRIMLEGSPPSALNPPSGCSFHTRCHRKVGAICETELPPTIVTAVGHSIACHIPADELSTVDPVLSTAT